MWSILARGRGKSRRRSKKTGHASYALGVQIWISHLAVKIPCCNFFGILWFRNRGKASYHFLIRVVLLTILFIILLQSELRTNVMKKHCFVAVITFRVRLSSSRRISNFVVTARVCGSIWEEQQRGGTWITNRVRQRGGVSGVLMSCTAASQPAYSGAWKPLNIEYHTTPSGNLF